jgi:DNA transformation protein and related proteins
MPKLNDFTLDVLSSLRLMRGVSARNMFGGAGVYFEGIFFGLTAYDRFYLRVDDTTRKKFIDAGMSCFSPSPDFKMKNYYEVPAYIQRRPEELCQWASEAYDIAKAAKKLKPKKKPKTKSEQTVQGAGKSTRIKRTKVKTKRKKPRSS